VSEFTRTRGAEAAPTAEYPLMAPTISRKLAKGLLALSYPIRLAAHLSSEQR
jgi:hypothetical protein